VSDTHKWFYSETPSDLSQVHSDNDYIEHLASVGLKPKRIPLTFRGGNVLIDDFKGKRIAFCGEDVIRLTRTVLKSADNQIRTKDQIKNIIKQSFNVDDVVIVSTGKPQPAKMFHLDQAMVFLSEGVVGLTEVQFDQDNSNFQTSEIKEVVAYLTELKIQLTSLGYQIFPIMTSPKNILNFQYHANGIPFIHAETHQPTYLMPVFSELKSSFEYNLEKANLTTIELLGYQVIPIPSKANQLNGGIHCLVNVIE
jgi:agmatine/peptidylarginine deiminase